MHINTTVFNDEQFSGYHAVQWPKQTHVLTSVADSVNGALLFFHYAFQSWQLHEPIYLAGLLN